MAIPPDIDPPAGLTPGGYYAVTGAPTPATGTTNVLGNTGPWLITEQALTINYMRVPRGYFYSDGLNLSSCDAVYYHQNTILLTDSKARFTRRKSYAAFCATSYQQSQKFQIMGVSTDYAGNSYGTQAQFDASTFGVRGTVQTTQPYMKRQLWQTSDDGTEVDKVVEGATFCMGTRRIPENLYENAPPYSVLPYARVDTSTPQTQTMTNFKQSWIKSAGPGTFLQDQELELGPTFNLYSLPGGYGYYQETIQAIVATIDYVGNLFSAKSLYAIPPNVTSDNLSLADQDTGLSEYDISLHDYT
jgi:hypothetical protein